MARKKDGLPTRVRWDAEPSHLSYPQRRADSTESGVLERGAEYLVADLPEDLARHPSMTPLDGAWSVETPEALENGGE